MTSDKQDPDALLSQVRAFVRAEAYPLDTRLSASPVRRSCPLLNEKRQQVKNAWIMDASSPRGIGGLGLSLSEFAHVSEELGRTPIGHYLFIVMAVQDIGNMES